jgi:hypothetical protein
VAIPVFPSRAFRHHGVYVRTDSDLAEPADLLGRTVGVPEYQLTAVVWIRGILADRHELPVDAVPYRTGGMHEPGRVEKQALDLPAGIEVEPIPSDRTLVDLLLTGEIDALYALRTPRPMLAGGTQIRRLFADARAEEERYAAETGIFPIMHTVVATASATPSTAVGYSHTIRDALVRHPGGPVRRRRRRALERGDAGAHRGVRSWVTRTRIGTTAAGIRAAGIPLPARFGRYPRMVRIT